MKNSTLIFVYNADGGTWNTMIDIAHKIISPKTYGCQLCDLTHGIWTVRPEWKEFVDHFSGEMKFLHRDEFIDQYGLDNLPNLPTILLNDESNISQFMDVVDIKSCIDVKALIAEIERRWDK